jgi:mannose-6-phosphate isomerase-like protein (cupin superfamily)
LNPGKRLAKRSTETGDQFFRVEKGKGELLIDGNKIEIKSDTGIVVPAGSRHNIKNTGDKSLKLYTLYAPPEHRDGTVQATKAEAKASKEHFDGKTTE